MSAAARSGRFTLRLALALGVLWACGPATPTALADDPELRHRLDELVLRQGAKPWDRLFDGEVFPSERTVFHDTRTGAEIWRLTDSLREESHVYYDHPAWNSLGTALFYQREAEAISAHIWLLPADAAWTDPVADFTDEHLLDPDLPLARAQGSVFWSWADPGVIYSEIGARVFAISTDPFQKVELFDLMQPWINSDPDQPPIVEEDFLLVPPHPLDDRLLFGTFDKGRIFTLDLAGPELSEVPTDGRWYVPPELEGTVALHRLRWTKDPDEHLLFIGQDNWIDDGQVVAEPVQYIGTLDGELTEWNLPDFENRGGHPDLSMDGSVLNGTYGRELWVVGVDGVAPIRRIFAASMDQYHASWTWDDRWVATDNPLQKPGADPLELRGFDVAHSNVLVSPDGRAQNVINYHYSSYAIDESTHPGPTSSPDGTKLVYDSDMLDRASGDGGDGDGNPDLWMVVVRPPSPPRNVAAISSPSDVLLTWERPLHAAEEQYWNPGNLAREIAGYNVFRSEASGGPYVQLNDEPIVSNSFVDGSIVPGVPYYYVVEAVEHSGLVSLYSREVFGSSRIRPWQGDLLHYYEAESAEMSLPMVPQFEPRTTRGDWFAGTFAREPDPDFPLEAGPAAVTLELEVPLRGRYTLWVRAKGFDAGGTLEVEVEGEAVGELTVAPGDWEWISAGGTLSLVSGLHTLRLSTSDPGIGVDSVALQRGTEGPPPPALGNRDVVPPEPPSDPRLVRLRPGLKRLVWEAPADRDVAYYNVYCGRDASYALGNERILRSPLATEAFDWGIPHGLATVYKIAAVDRYGNESAPVVFDPGVDGEESAPVAVDDLYEIDEDELLVLPGPGLHANDLDGDGDPLTPQLSSGVEHGVLELAADGGFTYTPDTEFSGEDGFTYRASDGVSTSGLATVTISIAYVDDPPVATDNAYETEEDGSLTVQVADGPLADDVDPEEADLTAELRQDTSHGTLDLSPSGVIHYWPDDDFHGVDSFTYVASDGVNVSNEATVTLTVHPVEDLPVAEDDDYTAEEDVALQIAAPGVLANDTDDDDDPLQAVLDDPPANGTVDLNADGSFTYTPDPDYAGFETFTYTATDGKGSSDPAVVRIVVSAVNDPPVASPDAYAVDEDQTLQITSPGVLGNDVDVEGDHLDALLVTGVAHGTLNLRENGSFVYSPDDDYHGADGFTYVVSDGVGTSNEVAVTLTVNPVEDLPVAEDDDYAAEEDVALQVAAPGVLANDSDDDGDPLQAVLAGPPANGSVDLNGDGSFTYTPDPDYAGFETFTYTATDGKGSSDPAVVRIVVSAVNDPPHASPDSYGVDEDESLEIPSPGVLGNDVDVEGDHVDALLVTDVAHGSLTLRDNGAFLYSPDPDFHGVDGFEYAAFDGQDSSPPVSVTLTVAPVDGGASKGRPRTARTPPDRRR